MKYTSKHTGRRRINEGRACFRLTRQESAEEEEEEEVALLSPSFLLPPSFLPASFRVTCPQLCVWDMDVALMKTPVDLSKDIDERGPEY